MKKVYAVKVGGRIVSKHGKKATANANAKKYRASIALQKKRGLTKGKVNKVTISKM